MTELVTIPLPCSVAALEKAILHTAHQGHWHDAEVRLVENRLVIAHRESAV